MTVRPLSNHSAGKDGEDQSQLGLVAGKGRGFILNAGGRQKPAADRVRPYWVSP